MAASTPSPARYSRCLAAAVSAAFLGAAALPAQQDSVVGTVHNLSVSGPGQVRAVSETEVCKFCHIPHNAVQPVPLWGHRLSQAKYAVPTLRTRSGREPAPQPDGSSRLCLSCHDGTVALGDIAGEPKAIAMADQDRLRPGQRGFLGTDLSGSHPISFVVPETDPLADQGTSDIGLRPLAAILSDGEVKLDHQGKMQCNTCHDPHSDSHFTAGRTPRFWVKPTIEEVCLTCHALR